MENQCEITNLCLCIITLTAFPLSTSESVWDWLPSFSEKPHTHWCHQKAYGPSCKVLPAFVHHITLSNHISAYWFNNSIVIVQVIVQFYHLPCAHCRVSYSGGGIPLSMDLYFPLMRFQGNWSFKIPCAGSLVMYSLQQGQKGNALNSREHICTVHSYFMVECKTFKLLIVAE